MSFGSWSPCRRRDCSAFECLLVKLRWQMLSTSKTTRIETVNHQSSLLLLLNLRLSSLLQDWSAEAGGLKSPREVARHDLHHNSSGEAFGPGQQLTFRFIVQQCSLRISLVMDGCLQYPAVVLRPSFNKEVLNCFPIWVARDYILLQRLEMSIAGHEKRLKLFGLCQTGFLIS